MIKIFCILLLHNENKNKNVDIIGQVGLLDLGLVLPETHYFFMGFSFLKQYSPNYPNHFWSFFGWV